MLRVLVLGFVLLTGCASAAADPACEAGKVATCPCGNGEEATQTCKDDGSGWGACGCSLLDPAQRDPDVACRSEITGPDTTGIKCPAGKRTFLICQSSIVQTGVCYHDTGLTTYCCEPN